MTIHQDRVHPVYVEGCFGCQIATVSTWGTTPSRSQGAGRSNHAGQKKWDAELDRYREARKQGIQPKSTKTADINRAVEMSNMQGVAFDAGTVGRPGDKFTQTILAD